MSDLKHMMTAITDGDAQFVDLTRQQARDYSDGKELPEEFLEALDSAQGDADEDGKTTYVVISIKGAAL